MNIQLAKMEVSDMLDILHVIFEDDNSYSSEDEMKSKLKMREILYEDVYGWPFRYKYREPKNARNRNLPSDYDALDEPLGPPATQDFSNLGDINDLKPFNPRAQQPQKRKKPPTIEEINAKPFNPDEFGGTFLGAPLN